MFVIEHKHTTFVCERVRAFVNVCVHMCEQACVFANECVCVCVCVCARGSAPIVSWPFMLFTDISRCFGLLARLAKSGKKFPLSNI